MAQQLRTSCSSPEVELQSQHGGFQPPPGTPAPGDLIPLVSTGPCAQVSIPIHGHDYTHKFKTEINLKSFS